MEKNFEGKKMKTQKYLILLLLFFILKINLGCGKKGPPKPPKEVLGLNMLLK